MRAQLMVLLLFSLIGRSASALEADIAAVGPGTTTTLSVPSGTPLDVTLVNRAPSNDYTIALIVRNIEVEALDVPAALAPAREPCDEVRALRATSVEKEVPAKIEAVKAAVQQGRCNATEGQSAIDETRRNLSPQPYTLEAGQELVLTVERDDSTKTSEKAVWTFVWTTGPRGQWRASYGFGSFEDDQEEFFTRPAEDGETFLIVQEKDRGDLEFVPAVFFSWARRARALKNWDYGPTGGLGFNLSKPIIFVGYQLTYNQNYTLNFGLVARPEQRLDGQYEVGQVLREDLEQDQLQDDSSYGPGLFVGLSYRFSSNPFKTEE